LGFEALKVLVFVGELDGGHAELFNKKTHPSCEGWGKELLLSN
jgi:hypothetical protein